MAIPRPLTSCDRTPGPRMGREERSAKSKRDPPLEMRRVPMTNPGCQSGVPSTDHGSSWGVMPVMSAVSHTNVGPVARELVFRHTWSINTLSGEAPAGRSRGVNILTRATRWRHNAIAPTPNPYAGSLVSLPLLSRHKTTVTRSAVTFETNRSRETVRLSNDQNTAAQSRGTKRDRCINASPLVKRTKP